jgi:hypothetical protein
MMAKKAGEKGTATATSTAGTNRDENTGMRRPSPDKARPWRCRSAGSSASSNDSGSSDSASPSAGSSGGT